MAYHGAGNSPCTLLRRRKNNFGQAISTCFAKYATFSTRVAPEFWWFFLFQILVSIVTSFLGEVVNGLVALALVLPALAVGARRLHDIGKSGWWQLIILTVIGMVLLIYWWVQPGSEGGNEHDPGAA